MIKNPFKKYVFDSILTGVRYSELSNWINFSSSTENYNSCSKIEPLFEYKLTLQFGGIVLAKNDKELEHEKLKLIRNLSEEIYGCYRHHLYEIDYLLQAGKQREARKLVGEIIESMFDLNGEE